MARYNAVHLLTYLNTFVTHPTALTNARTKSPFSD